MIGQYPENFRAQCHEKLILIFDGYAMDLLTKDEYADRVFSTYQEWKNRAEYILAEGEK